MRCVEEAAAQCEECGGGCSSVRSVEGAAAQCEVCKGGCSTLRGAWEEAAARCEVCGRGCIPVIIIIILPFTIYRIQYNLFFYGQHGYSSDVEFN